MLKSLKFVAVGGAPMKLSVAEPLVAAGVPVLNHWGVTEIGAIAPIMVPTEDYDWHYLRVRDDIHLRFEPIEEQEGHYRLIGRPPLIDDDFVVQDLLTCNPLNPSNEFRIAGRADDLVVLATGEKVRPSLLEQAVSENPLVRGALAFGDGKFQLGLIVEAAPHVVLDIERPEDVAVYVDKIWPSVEVGNEGTDHHGRVTREMIIVTHANVKPLTRTPKGSIPRGPNVAMFQAQVDELYARADTVDADPLPLDDPEEMKDAVRQAVHNAYTIRRTISDTDDFFERGMDSLQATMLRRRLTAALTLSMEAAGRELKPLPVDVVYANPSVDLLYAALGAHCTDGAETKDRLEIVREVAKEYVEKIASLRSSAAGSSVRSVQKGATVLLTGSSGSLGSAMLFELVSSPSVARVYALNRGGSRGLKERQEGAFKKLGVELSEAAWSKVSLVEAELGEARFGLSEEVYDELRSVSHILHNGGYNFLLCFRRVLIGSNSLANGLQPFLDVFPPTPRSIQEHHPARFGQHIFRPHPPHLLLLHRRRRAVSSHHLIERSHPRAPPHRPGGDRPLRVRRGEVGLRTDVPGRRRAFQREDGVEFGQDRSDDGSGGYRCLERCGAFPDDGEELQGSRGIARCGRGTSSSPFFALCGVVVF